MSVEVALHLYFKPEMMLASYTGPLHEQLREHANDLNQWLSQAADYLKRLHEGGWESLLLLYDVECFHPDVTTEAEAIERLRALDVDPKLFCIQEMEDEE